MKLAEWVCIYVTPTIAAVLVVAASNKNAIHCTIRERYACMVSVKISLNTQMSFACVFRVRACVRMSGVFIHSSNTHATYIIIHTVFLGFRKQTECLKRAPVKKWCKPIFLIFSLPVSKKRYFIHTSFFCSLIFILETIWCTQKKWSLHFSRINSIAICINANKAKQPIERVSECFHSTFECKSIYSTIHMDTFMCYVLVIKID